MKYKRQVTTTKLSCLGKTDLLSMYRRNFVIYLTKKYRAPCEKYKGYKITGAVKQDKRCWKTVPLGWFFMFDLL